MYKRTKKYRVLISRVRDIQKHFVASFTDKDVMELSAREMDLCRGYKVLCHAEIEYYFEEMRRKSGPCLSGKIISGRRFLWTQAARGNMQPDWTKV